MKILLVILFIVGAANLFAQNVEQGKNLYMAKCSLCHGDNGEGIKGEGLSLNNPDFLSIASDQYIRTLLKTGRADTKMVFSSRKKRKIIPHIGDLLAYIRSWETSFKNYKVIKLDPTIKVSGNKDNGAKLYKTTCSECHNSDASGYANGFSGKNIGPAIGFDDFLSQSSDDFIKKSIERGRRGKINESMPAFSAKFADKNAVTLKNQEINDIIVYLRSL